jgi:hypothetical protein
VAVQPVQIDLTGSRFEVVIDGLTFSPGAQHPVLPHHTQVLRSALQRSPDRVGDFPDRELASLQSPQDPQSSWVPQHSVDPSRSLGLILLALHPDSLAPPSQEIA